jgi:hypothetical protein
MDGGRADAHRSCVAPTPDDCDGTCTSLLVDPNNCGRCGNQCGPGQVCNASRGVSACIDPCAPFGDCKSCTPNAACGWCVSTNTCIPAASSDSCGFFFYGTC